MISCEIFLILFKLLLSLIEGGSIFSLFHVHVYLIHVNLYDNILNSKVCEFSQSIIVFLITGNKK